LKLEGVELEEQSKAATEVARTSGVEKKQIVPPELLEEVFELNMQLQEMRMAKQMGEDEPELRRDLMTAKDAFDARMVETQAELEGLWAQWDMALEDGNETGRSRAKEAMISLLNKRSYLRNLVRDVNEALE
jgi:molecular chaperone HscB